MKNSTTTILAILIASCVQAQTILKPAPLSSWHIGTNSIDFNDTTIFAPHQAQKFMLGWQWAGPNLATNTRLSCNVYQDNYGIALFQHYYSKIPRSGNRNFIIQGGLQTPNDCVDVTYLHGTGIQFDPIAPTSLNAASPHIDHDTTAAVFGFITRNTGTLSAYPLADFNRFNRACP